MQELQDILYRVPLQELSGPVGGRVSGLAMDSRLVEKGMLFAALRGTRSDGHQFIPQAIKAGATAILCEALPFPIENGVTYLRVDDSTTALAVIAGNFYDHQTQKLKMIVVPGCNGKKFGND